MIPSSILMWESHSPNHCTESREQSHMNRRCKQEQGKLSSQGVENVEFSHNIRGEPLVSDFKSSDFERLNWDFNMEQRVCIGVLEGSKLGATVDICCLGSTAVHLHKLNQMTW